MGKTAFEVGVSGEGNCGEEAEKSPIRAFQFGRAFHLRWRKTVVDLMIDDRLSPSEDQIDDRVFPLEDEIDDRLSPSEAQEAVDNLLIIAMRLG